MFSDSPWSRPTYAGLAAGAFRGRIGSMPGRPMPAVDRAPLVSRFLQLRERSRRLFDLLTPDAYYIRPIALRHPIVFYEGHLAAFSFNTVVKRALGQPGVDAHL